MPFPTLPNNTLNGANAIVTGAGSGIGAALTHELVKHGVHVVASDIDADAVEQVAEEVQQRVHEGGGTVEPVDLDVTDAQAVQELVDRIATERGSLDLMFNNAGIVFGGETELLTLDHWNSTIDVNIRGVVHGVHAAYPRMVEQGHGHIINTASMGGLMAAGLLTTYVTSKHAVVGLSLALRSEAASKGVGVTAICPSAVDTPILDKGAVGKFNGRDYFLKGQGVRKPLPPEKLAEQVVAAIDKNKALLVTPRASRIAWRLGRLSPAFVQWSSIRFVDMQRRLQHERVGE